MKNELDMEVKAGLGPNQHVRYLTWTAMSLDRIEQSWLLGDPTCWGRWQSRVPEHSQQRPERSIVQVGGQDFSSRISTLWTVTGLGDGVGTNGRPQLSGPGHLHVTWVMSRPFKKTSVLCLHFHDGIHRAYGILSWGLVFQTSLDNLLFMALSFWFVHFFLITKIE